MINYDRKLLFLLPEPVTSPDDKYPSLYSLSYVLTDLNFNIIDKNELITCKGYDYRLPSPSYLFTQGIDPYTIKNGLSVEKFLDESEKILHNPNVTIFTWSIRNLKILESMCLRQFREPTILDNVYALTDVNKVLKLSELFTEGKCLNTDSLLKCAFKYGFKEKLSIYDRLGRLRALIHIVKELNLKQTALLNYMSRPHEQKGEQISKAIGQGKFLVDYNVKERSLEVLKPLSLNGNDIDALYFDGNEVRRKYYRLGDFGVLSPATVLTQERQALVNIPLTQITNLLASANLECVKWDEVKNYSKEFFKDFSQKEYEEYQKILFNNTKEAVVAAPLTTSSNYRNIIFLFRGNNYKGTLLDSELTAYFKVCAAMIEKQLPNYVTELKYLSNSVNENSDEELKLINKIKNYPMDL